MSEISSTELWENRGRIFGAAIASRTAYEPQVGVLELAKVTVRAKPVTEKVSAQGRKTRKLVEFLESVNAAGDQGPCGCSDLDKGDPLAWCKRCGY